MAKKKDKDPIGFGEGINNNFPSIQNGIPSPELMEDDEEYMEGEMYEPYPFLLFYYRESDLLSRPFYDEDRIQEYLEEQRLKVKKQIKDESLNIIFVPDTIYFDGFHTVPVKSNDEEDE